MVERFLQFLARRLIRRCNPKIIAITGSVGKSSTRDACASVLALKYRVQKDFDSVFNDSISVPLAILGATHDPKGHLGILLVCLKSIFLYHGIKKYPEFLVLEIRARKPGEIDRTLEILGAIDVAIFTAMPSSPVHSEFFSSAGALYKEKSRLLNYVKKRGLVLLNYDDDRVLRLAESAKKKSLKVKTVGFDNDAMMFAESPILDSDHAFFGDKTVPVGVSFKLHYGDGGQNTIPIRLPKIFSIHHVYPVLFALSLAEEFDINFVDVSKRFLGYAPPRHRMEVIQGVNDSTLVDDSYNASPASVEAALVALTMMKVKGKRIVILGDMLELGDNSEKAHREVGKKAAEVSDNIILFGEKVVNVREGALSEGFDGKRIHHFLSKDDLVDFVTEKLLQGNDLVLIKGSRRLKMEEIVEKLRK